MHVQQKEQVNKLGMGVFAYPHKDVEGGVMLSQKLGRSSGLTIS